MRTARLRTAGTLAAELSVLTERTAGAFRQVHGPVLLAALTDGERCLRLSSSQISQMNSEITSEITSETTSEITSAAGSAASSAWPAWAAPVPSAARRQLHTLQLLGPLLVEQLVEPAPEAGAHDSAGCRTALPTEASPLVVSHAGALAATLVCAL